MTATIDDLIARIRQKAERPGILRARVLFDFGPQGKICVDSTVDPPRIDQGELDADLTVLCTMEIFDEILSGTKDPSFAFLMGQIKIQGSMGLALKLNTFLES